MQNWVGLTPNRCWARTMMVGMAAKPWFWMRLPHSFSKALEVGISSGVGKATTLGGGAVTAIS